MPTQILHPLVNSLVSLLPVFLFLGVLLVLDGYKLVAPRSIFVAIGVGALATIPASLLNEGLIMALRLKYDVYSRYGAPIVEEILKCVYVVYLMKSKRIGFMVDAALYGFAVGAGFAFVENIYYLQSLSSEDLLVWIARGLGTAIMHGGTTAIFGVITKTLLERSPSFGIKNLLPGLLISIVIHSFFNHFLVSPLIPTAFLLALFPIVFWQSEKTTRKWLGVGLDTDLQLLEIITGGDIAQSRIGDYFLTLQKQFRGEIIVDMICLIRLHTELAIRAKGILMMRSGGFNPPPGADLPEKFTELRYLQKSIGTTGQLALAPVLHMSSRDLWQIHMLSGR